MNFVFWSYRASSFVRQWHSENLADTIPAPLTERGN